MIGGEGTVGGDGIGGGLAVTSGDTAAVSHSIFLSNRAHGGDGETGGDGLGGGIAIVESASLSLTQSVVVSNRAIAGEGTDEDGEGLGGGVYNGGDADNFSIDAFSLFWTRFNFASDDGDDIFGDFDLL